MDELTRLRDFRPLTVAPTATRTDAARALNAAMTGGGRRAFGPVWIVALVGAAALATAAYAVVREVVIGAPAPPSVKHVIQRGDTCPKGLLLPVPCRPPSIDIANATLGAAITTPAGPVYLWVAPSVAANGKRITCEYLQIVANDLGGRPNMGRECVPDQVDSVGLQGTRVSGRWLSLLSGRVGVTGAHTLVVHFTNGTTRTYALRNPYVLADVGSSAATMPAVASTTVLNAKGRVLARHRYVRRYAATRVGLAPLARQDFNGTLLAPQHCAPTSVGLSPHAQPQHVHCELGSSQMRVVATVRLIGTNDLLVEKGEPDHECKELSYPMHIPPTAKLFRGKKPVEIPPGGMTLTVTGGSCGIKPPAPNALDIGPLHVNGGGPYSYVVFWGAVGVDVHTLTLYFQDGTSVQIPIDDGYVLYQLSPSDYASGHRPTKVVGLNASRKVVATQTVF